MSSSPTTDSLTNIPNDLKEELSSIIDMYFEPNLISTDHPNCVYQISEDDRDKLEENLISFFTTHFPPNGERIVHIGSKSYPHDYIKNNQDIIAGRKV